MAYQKDGSDVGWLESGHYRLSIGGWRDGNGAGVEGLDVPEWMEFVNQSEEYGDSLRGEWYATD
mgnify:CR=1 FL=1